RDLHSFPTRRSSDLMSDPEEYTGSTQKIKAAPTRTASAPVAPARPAPAVAAPVVEPIKTGHKRPLLDEWQQAQIATAEARAALVHAVANLRACEKAAGGALADWGDIARGP